MHKMTVLVKAMFLRHSSIQLRTRTHIVSGDIKLKMIKNIHSELHEKSRGAVVSETDCRPGGERLEFSCDSVAQSLACLLYTSPSPRDLSTSRMPSSA